MENWLPEQEFLETFAHHHLTGEVLPDSLIQKIRNTQRYHVGYHCVRQLTFGMLDMAWHTQTEKIEDITAFEQNAISPTQLLPVIDGTLISSQFSHVFGGGYAAGYYGYKWAEVLEKGDTEEPMTLYVRFRGREPEIEAMMRRDGIK